ncbi:MAG: phosphatase PAP2 family protein [Oscillospiraceae bacterium]|nr:phosphatase PAP2 family protein [Oscillospiraceae bacterium]
MSFDLPILDWIQANLQSGFLDFLMPMITYFGEDGIGWIAWAVLLLILKKHRKTGLGMAFALLIGLVVCNMTLKPLVGRIRPYDFQAQEFGITIDLLVHGLHDFSFPSGHTIASFEAATVLLINNKKMGIPAMILAVLIAFSRLYLYVHYPTDVIVSIVLGIAIAFLGNWLAGLCFKKVKKGRFER